MSAVRRRDLVWAVVLILVVTTAWLAASEEADAGTPSGVGIDVVYVAVGSNFPDALGVGPGAGVANSPIILVPSNPPIPAATESELLRLDPKNVVIVGGEAVISPAMESALKTLLPAAVVSRIAGANRYETNAMFSESIYPIEQWISVSQVEMRGELPGTDEIEIILGGGTEYNVANRTSGILLAPVHLPDGSRIVEFTASAFDLNTNSIVVSLQRVARGSGLTALASVATADSVLVQTLSTSVAGDHVVDNSLYSYVVRAENVSGTLQFFYGAAVKVRLGSP